MPSRLKKMQIKFVSLVDRGAHQDAEVVLAKRDVACPDCGEALDGGGMCEHCGYHKVGKGDPTGSDSHVPVPLGDKPPKPKKIEAPKEGKEPERGKGKTTPARKKELVDGVPQDDAEVDDGQPKPPEADEAKRVTKHEAAVIFQKSTTGAQDAVTVPLNVTTEESMSDTNIDKGDFSELPAEALTYIEKVEDRTLELEEELTSAQAEIEALKAAQPVAKQDEGDPEDIFKGADPAVREHFTKMAADLAAAETLAKSERDLRLDREYLAKAESLSGLAVPAPELAQVLKAAGETSPEQLAALTKVLDAASKAVSQSALFSEIGKRSEPTTTEGKVETIAKALQSKDPALTHEAAVAQAYQDNPALYSQYIEEVEA